MYYSTGSDDGGTAGPVAVPGAVPGAVPVDGTGAVPGPVPSVAPGAGMLVELEAAERVRLIEEIRALEDLKGAIAAAQARAAAAFDTSTRRAQAAAGLKAGQLGKGVAAEIALARRESPHHGGKLLGLARILTTEMPHTLTALSAGVISEWRATLLVREAACLSLADRQEVDRQVAGNLAELEQLGDRKLIARIKSLSYGLDPHAVVNRAAHAVAERFVSCRPAPDTMTYLTALLPVAQGVGVYAALTREADRLRAAGDPRTKGQIMADTFVERATGQARAEDARIEVQLIMTDQALLHGILPADPTNTRPAAGPGPHDAPDGASDDTDAVLVPTAGSGWSGNRNTHRAGAGVIPGTASGLTPATQPEPLVSAESAAAGQEAPFVPDGAEPAVLAGYGMVAAQWARDLIRGSQPDQAEAETKDAAKSSGARNGRTGWSSWGTPPPRPDPHTEVWLRRLYTSPTSGQLTAMDSRARLVPHGLARLIAARDQVCRTPWCGAPIRHYDHIKPVHAGGTTNAENIQGLCQACNQAKEAPGWEARPVELAADRGRFTGSSRHLVVTSTPTGHRYLSSAPPLPATAAEAAAAPGGRGRIRQQHPPALHTPSRKVV
ncbi:HNH endonuclease [Arthrobacter citreus]|uniref:HNH endonuclease n=1 Tax=Arthrobacter TaxID=1663 RepID=UPI001FE71DFD|nr:HNH endonuclease signature motif containing protein [Arthrobacter gandavensis]